MKAKIVPNKKKDIFLQVEQVCDDSIPTSPKKLISWHMIRLLQSCNKVKLARYVSDTHF